MKQAIDFLNRNHDAMDTVTRIKATADTILAMLEHMKDDFVALTDDDKQEIGWGDFDGEMLVDDLLNAIPYRINECGHSFEKVNCKWVGYEPSVQDVLEQIATMGRVEE